MASPEEMARKMIENLPEKTGKSLDDWLKVVKKSGLLKHSEIVKMLKADHEIGHGFANLIAHSALNGAAAADGDELIALQYAGAKADLRPVYDAVIAYVNTLGKDVEISPKKTSVSIRRSKQFALVQAATRNRVDLGINLKSAAPGGRLEAWGGMISHRVRLSTAKELDADVRKWLKQAYEEA
ncbi:MAG: DUF4287 domain-containing protein [Alphaproteobacteria bacterium]|nr:DUF4287 domain-containing protein [Alphaproteobacteria bacterium]